MCDRNLWGTQSKTYERASGGFLDLASLMSTLQPSSDLSVPLLDAQSTAYLSLKVLASACASLHFSVQFLSLSLLVESQRVYIGNSLCFMEGSSAQNHKLR
jgi:hypothetical protein